MLASASGIRQVAPPHSMRIIAGGPASTPNVRSVARMQRRLSSRNAAYAGAGGSVDPYQVLGIKPGSDNNTINRAYREKKYSARGNEELLAAIEAAHNSLMMSSLYARLQGQSVNRDVLYADREPLFPWRPKRWDATPKVILIIGVLQLALIAYGFQSPNMSKVIGSMLLGVAGNVLKQNAINPPPKDPSMATEEEQGRAGRNFVRGGLLALMATFGGVLLFSTPEMLAKWASVKLPAALANPGTLVFLKIAGAALANWLMTSFYY